MVGHYTYTVQHDTRIQNANMLQKKREMQKLLNSAEFIARLIKFSKSNLNACLQLFTLSIGFFPLLPSAILSLILSC